jgi:uncharacterized membrane protein YbaN (DUF454 family)
MATGLLQKARKSGPIDRNEGELPPFSLDIDIDEREGVLRIYDPRSFRAGRRAFCRRLIDAVAGHPGFEKAEIDLAAASCSLKFDVHSATADAMADAASAAIRQAASGPEGDDRARWWRRSSRWSTLTAYRTPNGVSSWETFESQPGRIELRQDALSGDRERFARLVEDLKALDGIERCRVSTWSRTLTVDFHRESPIAHRILDAVEQALEDGIAFGSPPQATNGTLRVVEAGGIEVATGYRRWQYLALAGGSFALTLLGLVVPGIPTVPFLLATSYYLARSSPRLNDRLRRTAVFGPILVEWEQYHGLSRLSKAKLAGLTAAIVAVTVVLSAASPAVLVVILVISLLSLYGIVRIPGLPHEASAGIRSVQPAGLALPSP